MDHGLGMPDRRTFLASALGTAGLVVSGCNSPTVSDLAPSPDLEFRRWQRRIAQEGLRQLAKRDMTGVFFVMTVVLGKSGWMTTRDIKRLIDAGMTIGSHTWNHHAVSDLSGRDWKIQLEQSRAMLRRASGQPVEHFAYPYGIVNTKAFPHLRHAGYRTAFQLEAKKLDHQAPLYTLRRSIVISTWSGAALLRHLTKHRP
jgi:peptidoglycan/xylan/chitin deacetylase (PgdA/CDA1 family)